MTGTKIIKLYNPTEQQVEVHKAIGSPDNDIIILVCGRRWGKNITALNDCLYNGLKMQDKIIWWCSPVVRQAKRDYMRLKIGLVRACIKHTKNDTDLRLQLESGTAITFLGLDEPDNIEGEGVDLMYIDEAAKVSQYAWENILSPMLLDTRGKAVLFSKPKGKNWFYHLYMRGVMEQPRIKSFRFKSSDNPYIDKDRLEQDISRLPARVVAQEYNAEFLDSGSGIFAGYTDCIGGDLSEPEEGKYYRIGVDVAKHEDYTVLIVVDTKEKQVVNFERFNNIEWGFIKKRIFSKAILYNNAEVIIDATGVGDPVFDDLRRAGLHIIPFKFTNTSKTQLIENLSIIIQNKQIQFPAIPELMNELDIFEIMTTPGGAVKYSAPKGLHDDCVIALALACWDIEKISEYEEILVSKEPMFNTDLGGLL